MKYSIIIITKDRRNLLKNCLDKIQLIKVPAEVIVVEACDDESFFKREGIKYISIPKNEAGFSKQRNIGINNAKGQYIIFIDDDCEITKDWFYEITKPIENGQNPIGVLGSVFPLNPGIIGFFEGVVGHPAGGFRRHFESKNKIVSAEGISTCNVLLNKKAVVDVGMFSLDKIYGGEDSDLSIKITSKYGLKSYVYNPKAQVFHQPRGTILKLIPWYIKKGRAIFDLYLTKVISLKYLIQSSILPKILIIFLISFILQSPIIFLFLLLLWYFLILFKHRYMINYFKFYSFSNFKKLSAIVLFPFIKILADLMCDYGKILKYIKR